MLDKKNYTQMLKLQVLALHPICVWQYNKCFSNTNFEDGIWVWQSDYNNNSNYYNYNYYCCQEYEA